MAIITDSLDVVARPRLAPADRIARWRRDEGANTPGWAALKANADNWVANINTPGKPENDPANLQYGAQTLGKWAIVYQVNYDQRVLALISQVLRAWCVPANDLSSNSYWHMYDEYIPAALALDLCDSYLAPAVRTQVAGWLMDRADEVWPDTNPARVNGWAVAYPDSNYFYGFLSTWVGAIAAKDIDPRADKHIALAQSKYRKLVRPYLDGAGAGGIFAESTSYDSAFTFARILSYASFGHGKDYANEDGFTFLADSLRWRPFSVTQDFNFQNYYGGQTRVPSAAVWTLDALRAAAPAGLVNDPVLRGWGNQFVKNLIAANPPDAIDQGDLFEWYDPQAPCVDYTTGPYASPLWVTAGGVGKSVRRSSWNADATLTQFSNSVVSYGHEDQDQNNIEVFKGSGVDGWLVGGWTHWSPDGEHPDSIANACITIGGIGQDPSTSAPAHLVKSLHTADCSIWQGEAAGAYPPSVLTECFRTVVYIPSIDSFVIVDRVTRPDTSKPIEFNLTTRNAIGIPSSSSSIYAFSSGSYKLFGSAFARSGAITITDVPWQDERAHRMVESVKSADLTVTLINVWQVLPIGATAMRGMVLTDGSVALERWNVLVDPSGSVSVTPWPAPSPTGPTLEGLETRIARLEGAFDALDKAWSTTLGS